MGERKFTVSYAVAEHSHREVDTVSVDPDTLPENVSIEEQVVELAAERSIYTHEETLSVSERNPAEAGTR